MVREILDYLVLNNLKITFAESCTGGMIASTFILEQGASNAINEAYVTYANESKIKILNVNEEDILNYGVVSEKIAYEMCVGAAKAANADIAIATTGIAGPSEDMGKVCFGYYIMGKTITKTKQFNLKTREEVIKSATLEAFNELKNLINILKPKK